MLYLGLAHTIVFEMGSAGLARGLARNQVRGSLIDAFLHLFYYDNMLDFVFRLLIIFIFYARSRVLVVCELFVPVLSLKG